MGPVGRGPAAVSNTKEASCGGARREKKPAKHGAESAEWMKKGVGGRQRTSEAHQPAGGQRGEPTPPLAAAPSVLVGLKTDNGHGSTPGSHDAPLGSAFNRRSSALPAFQPVSGDCLFFFCNFFLINGAHLNERELPLINVCSPML